MTTLDRAVKPVLDDTNWALLPIGVEIGMNPIVALPPTNLSYRYIVLTAGQAGSGGYNQGCLTSESVSGSDPVIVATATISLATSSLNGLTVDLINTSRVFPRPGSAAGAIVPSQNAAHYHAGIPRIISLRLQGSTTEYGLYDNNGVTTSSGGAEANPRYIPRIYLMRIK